MKMPELEAFYYEELKRFGTQGFAYYPCVDRSRKRGSNHTAVLHPLAGGIPIERV